MTRAEMIERVRTGKAMKYVGGGLVVLNYDWWKKILEKQGFKIVPEPEDLMPKWIRCEDQMPDERDTIFARLKGTPQWRPAMFERMSDDVRVVVAFGDGTRMVKHGETVDGKWHIDCVPKPYVVTHWMPNPVLPEVNDD